MLAILIPEIVLPVRTSRRDVRLMGSRDDSYQESRSKVEYGSQNTTDLPRDPHAFRLFTLGPDKVEEEGRSENESDEDAGEDVVGASTHIVVVEDLLLVVRLRLHLPLSVYVICIAMNDQ